MTTSIAKPLHPLARSLQEPTLGINQGEVNIHKYVGIFHDVRWPAVNLLSDPLPSAFAAKNAIGIQQIGGKPLSTCLPPAILVLASQGRDGCERVFRSH